MMMEKKTVDYSLPEIADVAGQVWEILKDTKVVVLKGEMGAGKTTFVSAMARYLGCADEVSSPTFAIVNEYAAANGKSRILHLDLYRIDDLNELIDMGMEDLLESNYDVMFIEWPQLAAPFLPAGTLQVQLEKTGADTRHLEITPYDFENPVLLSES